MFGYINVNQEELRVREVKLYRSYYCGVCHSLKKNYGFAGQATLSYDMTFLALLLHSLYEDDENIIKERCLPHPFKPHTCVISEYCDYAAAVNVMLTYFKLKDNYDDDRNIAAKAGAGLLKRAYKKAGEAYPRQRQAIEDYILEQSEAEKTDACGKSENSAAPGGADSSCRAAAPGGADSSGRAAAPGGADSLNAAIAYCDRISSITGKMMSVVFNMKDDVWKETLGRIGFYLGKFIYIMDAFEDVKKDAKKGSFNPFAGYTTEQLAYGVEDMLVSVMAEAAKALEILPILDNADILKNVLYSGVWARFNKIVSDNCKDKTCPANGKNTIKSEDTDNE